MNSNEIAVNIRETHYLSSLQSWIWYSVLLIVGCNIIMSVVTASSAQHKQCKDAIVSVKRDAVAVETDGGWLAGVRETVVTAIPLGNGTVALMSQTRHAFGEVV